MSTAPTPTPFPPGSIRAAVAEHGDRWARSSLRRMLQVLPCESNDWEAMAYRRHAYLGIPPAEVTR